MYGYYHSQTKIKTWSLVFLLLAYEVIETNARIEHAMFRATSSMQPSDSDEIMVYTFKYLDNGREVTVRQTEEEHEKFCESHIKTLCDYQHLGKISSEMAGAFGGWLEHNKNQGLVQSISSWWGGVDLPGAREMLDARFHVVKLGEFCGGSVQTNFFSCVSEEDDEEKTRQCSQYAPRGKGKIGPWRHKCEMRANTEIGIKCVMGFQTQPTTTYNIADCEQCGTGCKGMKLVQKQFDRALKEATDAMTGITDFREGVISGAGAVVKNLELTRDVSFAIVVGCAAATAAPMAVGLAKGYGVTGIYLVGAGGIGGSVGAGTAAAGLNLIKQSSDVWQGMQESYNWNEFWGTVREAALKGLVGGAAGALGGLAPNALARPIEIISGRMAGIAQHLGIPLTAELTKTIVSELSVAVVRQLFISCYKEATDDGYTSEDWFTDMALALWFAGIANGYDVKGKLGNGGFFKLEGLRFNDLAVTENMFRSAEKLASGLEGRATSSTPTSSDDGGTPVSSDDAMSSSTDLDEHATASSSTNLDGTTGSSQNVQTTPVDACVDRVTCCALAQAQPTSRAPVLKKGSKGDDVNALQEMLKTIDAHSSIVVDGDFGPGTKRIVKAFQSSNPTAGTSDGVVGENTWRALCTVVTAF